MISNTLHRQYSAKATAQGSSRESTLLVSGLIWGVLCAVVFGTSLNSSMFSVSGE